MQTLFPSKVGRVVVEVSEEGRKDIGGWRELIAFRSDLFTFEGSWLVLIVVQLR